MPNYRLTLCYDGSRYSGWQRQGNTENTIQYKLETALSRILAQSIELAGSGRTDAGVHARMQTASFRAKTALQPPELLSRLRDVLPEDIGALSLEEAPPRFHARLSCTGKTYLYRVWTSEQPCVFERKYVLPLREALDVAAMRCAAAQLCGEHDFSAFCGLKTKKNTVRRLDRIDLEQTPCELRLYFSGSGFLYHMARILTGTLLEVGLGRRSPGDIPGILASHERARSGPAAPAKGLCLWETRY